MNVLVNLFLRGIGMTLKMSAYEILQIENQHRLNLNVHLCILNGLFTSHPICWFLCYQHSSILIKRRGSLSAFECIWDESSFFSPCKEWYLCVFNLLFFSLWLSFLKDCTVFVGSFIMQKKVQVYSPVYLSCVRVFPSGPSVITMLLLIIFQVITCLTFCLEFMQQFWISFPSRSFQRFFPTWKKTWGAYCYMYSLCCLVREELKMQCGRRLHIYLLSEQ